MDTLRIRQLLDKRDDIDREIQSIVNGDAPKKTLTCSICGGSHTARTCPQKQQSTLGAHLPNSEV